MSRDEEKEQIINVIIFWNCDWNNHDNKQHKNNTY